MASRINQGLLGYRFPPAGGNCGADRCCWSGNSRVRLAGTIVRNVVSFRVKAGRDTRTTRIRIVSRLESEGCTEKGTDSGIRHPWDIPILGHDHNRGMAVALAPRRGCSSRRRLVPRADRPKTNRSPVWQEDSRLMRGTCARSSHAPQFARFRQRSACSLICTCSQQKKRPAVGSCQNG